MSMKLGVQRSGAPVLERRKCKCHLFRPNPRSTLEEDCANRAVDPPEIYRYVHAYHISTTYCDYDQQPAPHRPSDCSVKFFGGRFALDVRSSERSTSLGRISPSFAPNSA